MPPLSTVRAGTVREQLNERYMAGRPSNTLTETGVLVHVLDGVGIDEARPWESKAVTRGEGGAGAFLSASLFNARKLPHGLYSGGMALVVSPRSMLRCAYPQDSGTKSWTASKAATINGQRQPGCGPRMCTASDAPFPTPRNDQGYPCAFPPAMLRQCLETFDACSPSVSAYTEMVVALDEEFAFEAVVGGGGFEMHQLILKHFGLRPYQLCVPFRAFFSCKLAECALKLFLAPSLRCACILFNSRSTNPTSRLTTCPIPCHDCACVAATSLSMLCAPRPSRIARTLVETAPSLSGGQA